MDFKIFFATNRAHQGEQRVTDLLNQDRPRCGLGDGEALQEYFAACMKATHMWRL